MRRLFLILGTLLSLFAFSQEEKPFLILKKHNGPVLNVAFSPDGKHIASCGEDKTAILWNVENWEPVVNLPFHSFAVKAIAFLYTKEHQSFFTNGEYVVKQWNIKGEPVTTWGGFTTTLWSIDFSSDGRYMTAGSYEKITHIWDLASVKPEKISPLKGHERNTLVARFSNDGSQIVTGSLDMTIKLWNWKTGACVRTYKGHGGNIYDIRFSPTDTALFASASEDRGIRIWNKNEDKSIKTMTGHTQPIMSIAYTNDGNYILSGSLDKTIKLWEISSGNCIATLDQADMVHGIALSKDNKMIAAALNNKTVALWNLNISECTVNFYFGNEIQAHLDSLSLFRPKHKSEDKAAYEKRKEKQLVYKDKLYQDYFQRYQTGAIQVPKK